MLKALSWSVIMPSTINLSLTNELRAYVDMSCGDGTIYATPSEFLRALIRDNKERKEAEALRRNVLEGYHDVLHGRTVEFTGSLTEALHTFAKRETQGW
jgi:antitoxin ParD1/3/4